MSIPSSLRYINIFLRTIVILIMATLAFAAADHASAAENLVPNPSLETMVDSLPASWANSSWGDLRPTFLYPVSGYQSSRAAKITVRRYRSGDAKWYFDEIPVAPGDIYQFSDRYKASVATEVTIQYHLTDGTYSYAWIGDAPSSSTWKEFKASFTVPAGVNALTIFHLIARNGYLTVDAYNLMKVEPPTPFAEGMVSLVFDDGWSTAHDNALPILEAAGFKSTHYIITETYQEEFSDYMTAAQILDLAAKGHEIAAHSRTHDDLTTLGTTRLTQEVSGSRQDLFNLGIPSVTTFAYPYGSYNDKVIAAVKAAGFTAARSIIEGLNFKTGTDFYLLKWQGPVVSTRRSLMKQWIDEAIAQKGWLILSFHKIDNSGDEYSNSPTDLTVVVDYLKVNGVKVVTVAEGVGMLSP